MWQNINKIAKFFYSLSAKGKSQKQNCPIPMLLKMNLKNFPIDIGLLLLVYEKSV